MNERCVVFDPRGSRLNLVGLLLHDTLLAVLEDAWLALRWPRVVGDRDARARTRFVCFRVLSSFCVFCVSCVFFYVLWFCVFFVSLYDSTSITVVFRVFDAAVFFYVYMFGLSCLNKTKSSCVSSAGVVCVSNASNVPA